MYRFCVFLLCEGDGEILKWTADSLAEASGFEEHAELVILFRRKKYTLTPEALGIVDTLQANSVKCFWGAEDPNVLEDVVAYIENSGSEILLFLREGDQVDPYCLTYIDSFFKTNDENCGVVFIPTVNGAAHPLAYDEMPDFFKNLPPGGMTVPDDTFPTDAHGAAVLTDSMQEAGLQSELGLDAFVDMLWRVAEQQSKFGRINKVAIGTFVKKPVLSTREYLVSCIIPIYKVEKYLTEAIDSVLAQTIGFKENIQLILVDDGSPDGCGEICQTYLERYPDNIIFIKQENMGVSAARNAGLEVACGEFVAFLDGDDKYDLRFMESCVAFFREHGGETDVVAVPIEYFDQIPKTKHPLNYRFNKNKIIDIIIEPDCIQSTVHSLLVRRSALQGSFFRKGLKFGEDAEFIHSIIIKQGKLGLNKDVFYYLRKREEMDSATQNALNSAGWYTALQIYPRALIDDSIARHGYVTRYTQFTVMYGLQWYGVRQIPEEVLHDIEIDKIRTEVAAITQFIDDDVIKSMKNLHIWHMYHLLRLKTGKAVLDPMFELSRRPLWFHTIEEYGGLVHFCGFYNVAEDCDVRLIAICNDIIYSCDVSENTYKDIYFLGERVNTAAILDFYIPYTQDATVRFYFECSDGQIIPVRCRLSITCRLNEKRGSLVLGEKTIISRSASEHGNAFKLSALSESDFKNMYYTYIKHNFSDKGYSNDVTLLNDYFHFYETMSKKRIWLFMDRQNKADEGAEYLFRYCSGINDGIEKYFVIEESSQDVERMKKYGNVVYYGSREHKIIILFAEKFISSFFEYRYRNPFDEIGFTERQQLYLGLLKNKFVYLQHGVLKDDLSSVLNRPTKNIKLIVTASSHENVSLLKNDYSYRPEELCLAGAPRYDGLYNDKKNQILFMPTWRQTLSETDGVLNDKFTDSEYCKAINNLLNDERLIAYAKKCGYEILFKPHPRTVVQLTDFKTDPYVQIVPQETQNNKLYAEGSLLVTDYSSTMFDFAYLKKPVLYYHFEKHHWDTDYFEYETMGFGEVVTDHDELVNLMIRYMETGCVMDEKYEKRVEDFFTYFDQNNSERAYEAILNMS